VLRRRRRHPRLPAPGARRPAGSLVDAETGAEVGRHDGAYGFTVGQRRGLGLDRPGGDPRYVLSIEPVAGTVTVGPGSLLDVAAVTGSRPVWAAGSPPAESFGCLAQLRAHARAVPALVTVGADRVEVRLDEPVRGVATGQAVVLYEDDTVLGSATIAATVPAVRGEPAEAGSGSP
jgi:tRNA-specific 2-thiouridylase